MSPVLLPVFTFFKTILDFFLLFFFVCFLSTQTLEELLSLLLLIFVLLMPFGGIFQQKFLIFTAHFKNTTHSIGHQLSLSWESRLSSIDMHVKVSPWDVLSFFLGPGDILQNELRTNIRILRSYSHRKSVYKFVAFYFILKLNFAQSNLIRMHFTSTAVIIIIIIYLFILLLKK